MRDEDILVEDIAKVLEGVVFYCPWVKSGAAYKSEDNPGGCTCREIRPHAVIDKALAIAMKRKSDAAWLKYYADNPLRPTVTAFTGTP